MNEQDPDWWKPFYDNLLADLLLEHTTDAEIRRTTDFLIKVLGIQSGQRVFDQCCGSGRMSIAMAARGAMVTGVDLSASYIDRARDKAEKAGVVVDFHCDDAFVHRAAAGCDAAFNWWTSFGYAADDQQNLEMLKRAWESLSAGGKFALDFMNVPGLYRHFQPSMVTRGRSNGTEVLLVRESSLDIDRGFIHKRWTYLLEDGRRVVHPSAVRLYDPATLRRLFTEAGFANLVTYGDLDGSPLTIDSPRCIIIGQKPAALS